MNNSNYIKQLKKEVRYNERLIKANDNIRSIIIGDSKLPTITNCILETEESSIAKSYIPEGITKLTPEKKSIPFVNLILFNHLTYPVHYDCYRIIKDNKCKYIYVVDFPNGIYQDKLDLLMELYSKSGSNSYKINFNLCINNILKGNNK